MMGVEDRKAPVEVGQVLQLQISAVGAKGDGIGRKEGFVIFVPGTQKDDNVTVKITKVKATVAFAEVIADAQVDAEPDEPEAGVEDSEDFGEEEKEV